MPLWFKPRCRQGAFYSPSPGAPFPSRSTCLIIEIACTLNVFPLLTPVTLPKYANLGPNIFYQTTFGRSFASFGTNLRAPAASADSENPLRQDS